LKHGWRKSWQCASLVLGAVALLAAQTASRRVPELTLAGLQPGKSTLNDALQAFSPAPEPIDGNRYRFTLCPGVFLKIESDDQNVIQTITLSRLHTSPACTEKRAEERWRTGRGLKLGDSRAKVIALYGQPTSSGPSLHDGRELEFLFYAFDWAGPEVPQVLEVLCDPAAHGRVVQITLAFPTL
jgi:hypothetical protein